MTRATALAGSVLLAGLLVSGCAIVPVPTDVATPGMPNPEIALQQSMQRVDAEMAELGLMAPAAANAGAPVMPADLQRIVSFDFHGSLDDGVAQLAASVGYIFYTTGLANPQTLNVSIQIASVPVWQVFQALGAEAGDRATVQLDPLHHQVKVVHHV